MKRFVFVFLSSFITIVSVNQSALVSILIIVFNVTEFKRRKVLFYLKLNILPRHDIKLFQNLNCLETSRVYLEDELHSL